MTPVGRRSSLPPPQVRRTSRSVASSVGALSPRKRGDVVPHASKCVTNGRVLTPLRASARAARGRRASPSGSRASVRPSVYSATVAPGVEDDAVLGELQAGAHAEGGAARRHLAHAVAARDEHRVVAAAGDRRGCGRAGSYTARASVRKYGRRWPSRSRVRPSLTSAMTSPGRLPGRDGVVQQRARHRHDQRGGEPLAHDVAADDAQAAVAEGDVVVVVAAHVAEELDALLELEAVDVRRRRGEEVRLDAPRALDLGRHLELRRAQLVVQLHRRGELLVEASRARRRRSRFSRARFT